jgi:precorrin-2 dehydrogenase/sirohydrochlorin ferrochelatase
VLDLSARLVVVIGGGRVAVRKVRGLVESGAGRVRVVSPVFHADLPDSIERVQGEYQREHLSGAMMVFAATDSADVNDKVVQDAKAMGALVCRADTDEENAGDFATPAMFRQGPMLIAVSSGGSPALSALVRDRIANAIDPHWQRMAEAMQTLRPIIRRSLAPSRRTEAFRELCSDAAMQELSGGGVEGLHGWLKQKFPELSD